MTLSELPLHASAVVDSVQDLHANDAIARRLRELGFVKGEEVRLVARGPVGGEPLLVQV
ncbi:MAG: FeoA family protein, partial [Stenotrophomonas sp.]